jgi:hypothetical protein
MSEFTNELIIKYLENNLLEGDEKVLLNWIQASETNREFFLTCKKIYALGKIRHYSDPLLMNQALQTFNQRTKSTQKLQKRELMVRFSKYAALLFLILAIPALYGLPVMKNMYSLSL